MGRMSAGQAVVVFDAGASTGYGYDRLTFNTGRSFYCSLELGCVGSGLPLALGAGRPAVIEIPTDPEELPFPARTDVFSHRMR